MKRKHPNMKEVDLNANESKFATRITDKPNGDYLLTQYDIQPSVYINAGVYKIHNNKALVEISNDSGKKVTTHIPQIDNELNAFDTIEKFPDSNVIKRNLFAKLRTDHLNKKEKQALLNIISNNQNCFYLESDRLTFSNAVKHDIQTKDDIPTYTKN
jgi:hypothetical protein